MEMTVARLIEPIKDERADALERLAYRLDEVSRLTSIPMPTLRRDSRPGGPLPVVRYGRSVLVTRGTLLRLISGELNSASAPKGALGRDEKEISEAF